MDIPESVVEFYEAAKNLWEKADSIKTCDENNVEELLKALVVLHLKALYLPNFELRVCSHKGIDNKCEIDKS